VASSEDYFISRLIRDFKNFPCRRNIDDVVTTVMEKDRQKSTQKKRKALLPLVDPRREVKVPCPSVKGFAVVVVMPLPAAPAAVTRRVPSPVKASKVTGANNAKIGGSSKASRELFVDDYLIEDVSMFDAHTGLTAGNECVYYCVSLYDGVYILYLLVFGCTGEVWAGGGDASEVGGGDDPGKVFDGGFSGPVGVILRCC
jgi:hypothetical protein